MLTTALFLLGLYTIPILLLNLKYPKFNWDWSNISTSNLNFPKKFLWGVATAAHQVEGGHAHNNWAWWETQKDEHGQPRINNGEVAGAAGEHWSRYPQDIDLMKDLGVNTYRFSLSWSKINPAEHVFDEMVIAHYQKMINELLAQGITPMITLHHFEEPLWFMQLGGFEKQHNIFYFTQFVQKVFVAYGDRVRYWNTFNETEVYATQGYIRGEFPPGKQNQKLAGVVLRNMLIAHVKAYQLIKSLPHGEHTQIALVKNIFFFEPKNRFNLLDWMSAYFVHKSFNTSILNFFATGKYHFYIPFQANTRYTDSNAPSSIDFMGLNYYSHYSIQYHINPSKMTSPVNGEAMTDMDYTIYPEGIYRAIALMSRIKKPIIITETGIADDSDTRRGQFIERSMYAVSKAIEDGYDVRGVYHWSLIDNFEWNLGYSKRFGLYAINYATQERTLRNGAKVYQNIVKKFAIPNFEEQPHHGK